MFVVKLMRSGYSLRVSIPREVQKHLAVRRGDLLAIELRGEGTVVAWKLNEETVSRARPAAAAP